MNYKPSVKILLTLLLAVILFHLCGLAPYYSDKLRLGDTSYSFHSDFCISKMRPTVTFIPMVEVIQA